MNSNEETDDDEDDTNLGHEEDVLVHTLLPGGELAEHPAVVVSPDGHIDIINLEEIDI